MEKDPASILILPMLKLITDNVEANGDGEPCYQDVKLKHFLRENGYIVNHAVKIVKSILKYFDKCYGNAISEMSEVAVIVPADEEGCLLLDVSQILNCNV